MHSEEIKNLVFLKRSNGSTMQQIADDLELNVSSIFSILNRKSNNFKRKTGPKKKIENKHNLSITRYVNRKIKEGDKVTCSNIVNDLELPCSSETVRRHLRLKEYKFHNIPQKIVLSAFHKQKRLEIVQSWITKNINWDKIVFSDEKRFSRDGPDNWSTFMPKNSLMERSKHQARGGGIMIWGMLFPDGTIYLKEMEGRQNSLKYEEIIRDFAVPAIESKYNNDYIFQQDNCSIHTSAYMKEYFLKSNMTLLTWPANSPDLNLMETVWSMLSNVIYSSRQPKNLQELRERIFKETANFNTLRKQDLVNLHKTFSKRVCKLLQSNGNVIH